MHHLILWSKVEHHDVEKLEVKDTSCGYLPLYRQLVVTHTNPSLSNDCIWLDVIVGVQNSQGPHNVCEVAFKWQED